MKHISKKKYIELKQNIKEVVQTVNITQKKVMLGNLETKTLDSSFWDKQQEAQQIMEKIGELQGTIKEAKSLTSTIETLFNLRKIANKTDLEDLDKEYDALKTRLKDFTTGLYLSEQYDKNDAIISIHAGQGGIDAQDWAEILMHMYQHYFDRKKWKYNIIDISTGEEAGIHAATISVKGKYVYGLLKMENGIHRLVRLSPFNSQSSRETSFAAVNVLPVLRNTDEIDIQLLDNEIEFKAMRSGGPGGQSVNKTSSAVQLTHKPSGITVRCSEQRSQSQNRERAKEILRAKLWKRKSEKQKRKIKSLKGEQKIASWGNQVRNYILHPYKLVKDLRTGVESSNPNDVFNGKLDPFIDAGIRI